MREWPSPTIRSIASSRWRPTGRAIDVDARHHDLVDAPVAELDDRADHLLLLGLEDALLAAALDDQAQLLGRDLGLGARRRTPNRRVTGAVIRVSSAHDGREDAAEEVERRRRA